jgi:cytochrome P450
VSRARRRDRRVYLAGHPFLFALLAATRGRPVRRLGSRVVVHGTAELREVMTQVPLDRTSEKTTGGAIQRHEGSGALFDESGDGHRAARRDLAARLDSRGVAALRPAWTPLLDEVTARLASGAEVDLCEVADELGGRTTAALLGWDLSPADCRELARAARRTASSAAAEELPSLRRSRFTDHLSEAFGAEADPLGKMLALATVNTTYAAVPRAVAWTADAGLWADAADPDRREVLVSELLRVTAPTPMLPRVPAADARVGGVDVRAGEQLLLMARHAVDAHRRDPSVDRPAPAAVSQLVFGAGQHACPGARLARTQLADVLAVLAPFAPEVTRARPDRAAALPAWRELSVRATGSPA